MDSILHILLETFAWIGLGAGFVLAVIALVAHLADGTWLPASAVVEPTETGRVVRWFTDDGRVGEARLSPEDDARIGDADDAQIFYRAATNRIRFTPGSPAVRLLGWLAAALLGLGAISVIASLALLFAGG